MATVVFGQFAWDAEKAAANEQKHGVTFEEATTVFDRFDVAQIPDTAHPDRLWTVGFSSEARVLTVVSTEIDGDRVRIISARRATPRERRRFTEG